MRPKRDTYKICGALDTETTNLCVDGAWHAFVVCYQCNDLRGVDIAAYAAGRGDDVRIYREAGEVLAWLGELVAWGRERATVPIVCGYNLMFDLQTLMAALLETYEMRVSAQSSSNVYTLDLMQDEKPVLRFWDTYHLEMNGLEAMGRVAGLRKLKGDWDYTLVRTPETPLTREEVGYATRDVQVIPAYLAYLLRANDYIKPEWLGCRVITKTSLVRRMAESKVGPLRYRKGQNGRLSDHFQLLCEQETPKTFYSYALRRACFRGGFTFTAARFASTVQPNVASLDVTSMHHQYINGMCVPVHFRAAPSFVLRGMCEHVLSTTRDDLMSHYARPFGVAFHARIRFRNMRVRERSAFSAWGIALAPAAKFGMGVPLDADFAQTESNRFSDLATRMAGWCDSFSGATFAFGKLYKAEVCTMHVSELELWALSRVYEWGSYEPILGECTASFAMPPVYVTLQSQMLFEQKSEMKRLLKSCGQDFAEDEFQRLPKEIVRMAHDASNKDFLSAYYNSTIKGAFNSIYGTQAQDLWRCDYEVSPDGIGVDHDTVVCSENFAERAPKRPRVLYTYGMRIVGGSRVHLVTALELLYEAFGGRVRVTGGDTDSIKMSCGADVTDEDIMAALAPLHAACARARESAGAYVHKKWPELASKLDKVGEFDIESASDGAKRWAYNMDCWNKTRVSVAHDGGVHVTAAGVSRPIGSYNIETAIGELVEREGVEVLPECIGYNAVVDVDVAHCLQRTRPAYDDVFAGYVTDYKGKTVYVERPEAIALYPISRELAALARPQNKRDYDFLRDTYGRELDARLRVVSHGKDGAYIDYEVV